MIKIENITKIFKSKSREVIALKDFSFRINSPEIVGIVGPNGAGKTTLIKIMLGLISIDLGKIRIIGYDPYKKNKNYLSQIGFVSGQKNILNQFISVYSSLKLLGVMYGLTKDEIVSRTEFYAKKLDVKHILNSELRTLSLGERIKVELIASIYHHPRILFLDEPTIGLDFESQKQVHKILLEFQKEHNVMLLLTSHNGKDIKNLCNSLVVIESGEKVFEGNLKLLKDEKGSKYITSLKEELNL